MLILHVENYNFTSGANLIINMKKSILLAALGLTVFLVSCAQQHACPTYSNSGLKWNKHASHPYGGHKHTH